MAAPTSSVDDSMATRSGRTRVVEVARCVIACVERVVGACRVPRFDRATGRVRRVTRRVPDAAGTSRRATTGAFSRRAFSTTRSPHTRSPGHSPRTRCRRHVTTCHHTLVLHTRVLDTRVLDTRVLDTRVLDTLVLRVARRAPDAAGTSRRATRNSLRRVSRLATPRERDHFAGDVTETQTVECTRFRGTQLRGSSDSQPR